jgi:hypothetical protein
MREIARRTVRFVLRVARSSRARRPDRHVWALHAGDLGAHGRMCAKPRRMLASKLPERREPYPQPEPSEDAAAQSARFRIKIDPLGRVVPEIIPVKPVEQNA